MKVFCSFLVVLLTLCLIVRADLTSGLLAYYPFDGNADDVSGNGRAGTVHGATWISNGVHGGACHFASISEYISAPDAGLPSGDAPRTISLWLMLESSYTDSLTGMLIYGTNQSNKRIELGIDWRLGRNRYYFSPGGTAMLTDAVAAGPGTWAHLVYTYGGAGEHHLYVNGQISDGLSELGGAINTVLTGQLVLGGQSGFVGPDGGYLDEVRIYNRELSAQEIVDLYTVDSFGVSIGIFPAVEIVWNTQTGMSYQAQWSDNLLTNVWNNLGGLMAGNGSPYSLFDSTRQGAQRSYRVIRLTTNLTTGLLAYYPFDGNANDASGNDRAGTVHGATWISNGVHGGACRFASNSEYISAPDSGLPNGDAPRSISLWLMLESSYTNSLTGMLIYGTNQSTKELNSASIGGWAGIDTTFLPAGRPCSRMQLQPALEPGRTWYIPTAARGNTTSMSMVISATA